MHGLKKMAPSGGDRCENALISENAFKMKHCLIIDANENPVSVYTRESPKLQDAFALNVYLARNGTWLEQICTLGWTDPRSDLDIRVVHALVQAPNQEQPRLITEFAKSVILKRMLPLEFKQTTRVSKKRTRGWQDDVRPKKKLRTSWRPWQRLAPTR